MALCPDSASRNASFVFHFSPLVPAIHLCHQEDVVLGVSLAEAHAESFLMSPLGQSPATKQAPWATVSCEEGGTCFHLESSCPSCFVRPLPVSLGSTF